MQKRKKLSALALVLAMALSLGACNTGNAPSGTSSAGSAQSAAEESTGGEGEQEEVVCEEVTYPMDTDVKLTAWMWTDTTIGPYKSKAEMPGYQNLSKATGIDVEFTFPASGSNDVDQAFQLMLVSGTIPDLVCYLGYGGNQNYVTDGYFMDLAPIIASDAYNFNQLLASDEAYANFYQAMLNKGPILAVPAATRQSDTLLRDSANPGMYVRGDWLEELDIAIPETMDELTAMLQTLKDEKGLEASLMVSWDYLRRLCSAYGVYFDMYQEDGTVMYGPYTPQWKEYLAQMNEWYESGILAKNFAAVDSKELQSKMLNGQVAGTIGWLGGGVGTTTELAAADPNVEEGYKLTGIPYPVLEKGQKNEYAVIADRFGGRSYGTWAISAKCEHPDIAMRWIDYFYSYEGMKTRCFGIEGENYVMGDDGFPIFDESMYNDPTMAFSQKLNTYVDQYWPSSGGLSLGTNTEIQDQCAEAWAQGTSEAHALGYIPLSPEDADTVAGIQADTNTHVTEMQIKFITGERSLDEFDDYLNELKGMGMDEVLSIYQAAYDEMK